MKDLLLNLVFKTDYIVIRGSSGNNYYKILLGTVIIPYLFYQRIFIKSFHIIITPIFRRSKTPPFCPFLQK